MQSWDHQTLTLESPSSKPLFLLSGIAPCQPPPVLGSSLAHEASQSFLPSKLWMVWVWSNPATSPILLTDFCSSPGLPFQPWAKQRHSQTVLAQVLLGSIAVNVALLSSHSSGTGEAEAVASAHHWGKEEVVVKLHASNLCWSVGDAIV